MLMPMIQVSLIGYAVGGAFLSLGYLDLPYYIMAVVSMTQATIKERRAQRQVAATAAPPVGSNLSDHVQPAHN
ncbi:MAG: hypothetical protein HY021_03770 [Burkholderiales bacterium]|nr:hypothetical protein [Burkholderiales bacterium]